MFACGHLLRRAIQFWEDWQRDKSNTFQTEGLYTAMDATLLVCVWYGFSTLLEICG